VNPVAERLDGIRDELTSGINRPVNTLSRVVKYIGNVVGFVLDPVLCVVDLVLNPAVCVSKQADGYPSLWCLR
jgi:hypothetical protein